MPRDLATAQAELAEAQDALETLQERVRDGDAEVTPEQLATQRELITFAELRVEAAQRTETRIREEERAALGAAAKEAAEALITGPGMDDIAAATRAVADALTNLAALAHGRNAQIVEVGTRLVQLDEDLKAAGVVTGPWGSKRYGVWGDRSRLIIDGVGHAPRLDVGALSVAAVVAGLGVTPEGRQAQTEHAEQFHGLPNQVVRRLLEAYPQIAEALRVSPEEYAAADTRGRYALSEQGRRPLAEAVEG